jgi:hypothetical protein
MRNDEMRKKSKFQNMAINPNRRLSMDFLLEARTMDRSAYEAALASIRPLSEFEDIVGAKMEKTAPAIRKCITDVNSAISAKPDLMMQITAFTKLSKPQQQLLDAITSAEILKFSMLNAMDAVRMLLITDFEKASLYFDDEAIVFDIKAKGRAQQVMDPLRTQFSKIKELGNYEVYAQTALHMIIGKESTSAGQQISIPIKGRPPMVVDKVPVGKLYLTGRDSNGNPAPIPLSTKREMLKVVAPTADNDNFLKTIKQLSERPNKQFDIATVINDDFTIPTEAEGVVTSIWRALRKTSTIKPTSLESEDFAEDISKLTLLEFKKYFEALVSKTSNASGDMSTFDLADTLFFTGLAAVTGFLGLAPPPSPTGGGDGADATAAAAGAAGAAGGGGVGGGGGGGGGGYIPVNRSLTTFLDTKSFMRGTTAAEKDANKVAFDAAVDRDAMRRELNRIAGASNLVFTESVDRWCKLAGIKEIK